MLNQSLQILLSSLPGSLSIKVNWSEKESVETWSLGLSGIALDSRQVTEGNLFVALSGGNTDGHRCIPDALSRGAAAIVGEQDIVGLHQPYIRVSDSRLALAHLSAAFYGFPARRLTVIGVTGTDGKTWR